MTLDEALVRAGHLTENRPRPYKGPFGSLYEDLTPQLIAGASRFSTGFAPIIAATLRVVADSAPASALNVDEETGEFNVDPLPVTTLVVAYHYQRFAVATLTDIITSAVQRFRCVGVEEVPSGLYPAMYHYIRGEGYTILAVRAAEQVNVTLGPRSESRGSIGEKFLRLADQEFRLGDAARDSFYQKAGRQFDPARGRVVYRIPTYTPPR